METKNILGENGKITYSRKKILVTLLFTYVPIESKTFASFPDCSTDCVTPTLSADDHRHGH